MAKQHRDPAREALWRNTFKRFAASGLSVREFCKRENVTESAFYAWRRTVAERNGEAKRQTGLATASPRRGRPPRAPAFLPMMVTDRSARGIELELAGGRILRLPESMPVERLAELVQALEASASR
jgi:transposase-like protein